MTRNEFVDELAPPIALLAGVALMLAAIAGCATPEQRLRSLASVKVFASRGLDRIGGPGKLRDYDQDSTEFGVEWAPFVGLEPPQRMIIVQEAAAQTPPELEDMAFEEAARAGATTPATPHRWTTPRCEECGRTREDVAGDPVPPASGFDLGLDR